MGLQACGQRQARPEAPPPAEPGPSDPGASTGTTPALPVRTPPRPRPAAPGHGGSSPPLPPVPGPRGARDTNARVRSPAQGAPRPPTLKPHLLRAPALGGRRAGGRPLGPGRAGSPRPRPAACPAASGPGPKPPSTRRRPPPAARRRGRLAGPRLLAHRKLEGGEPECGQKDNGARRTMAAGRKATTSGRVGGATCGGATFCEAAGAAQCHPPPRRAFWEHERPGRFWSESRRGGSCALSLSGVAGPVTASAGGGGRLGLGLGRQAGAPRRQRRGGRRCPRPWEGAWAAPLWPWGLQGRAELPGHRRGARGPGGGAHETGSRATCARGLVFRHLSAGKCRRPPARARAAGTRGRRVSAVPQPEGFPRGQVRRKGLCPGRCAEERASGPKTLGPRGALSPP